MRLLISTFISIIFLSSCSYYLKNDYGIVTDSSSCSLETKSYDSYMLSKDDVSRYAHSLLSTKNADKTSVVSISPVELKGRVVFYVVNFDKGWQVISSDKRGPTIIAECPDGSFEYEKINVSI